MSFCATNGHLRFILVEMLKMSSRRLLSDGKSSFPSVDHFNILVHLRGNSLLFPRPVRKEEGPKHLRQANLYVSAEMSQELARPSKIDRRI